jgi:hypothetical protein
MSKRTKWLSLIGVIAALVVGWQIAAFAGPVGLASGFQDDDGNLTPNTPNVSGTLDWNSFAPAPWTGSTPNYQTADKPDANGTGWHFFGMQDQFKDSAPGAVDSIYSGGVKQVDNCPATKTGSAPNKDDLKRAYFSTKTLTNGHVILNLAWVRIPLNTPQSDAHLSFEFNKGTTNCSGAALPNGNRLVNRTVGDLLILYDFGGQAGDVPLIRLSRWQANGTWTNPITLPAGTAEAAVNQVTVPDELSNTPDPNTNPASEGLDKFEFGEAGIDLTNANIFPSTPTECVTFGKVSASSRSAGSSNDSAMKDLAGPGNFNLTNCGQVITRKVTDPTPDPNDHSFGFTTNVEKLPAATTSPFSLKDGQANTITNVKPGSYNTTEDDPTSAGYQLTDIDCSASDTATDPTEDVANRKATFTIGAGETVDCTFTNTLQQGALSILKNSTKGGAVSEAGAVFSYDGPSGTANVTDNGANDENPAIGEVCVTGLQQGDYDVTETSAPAGYGLPVDTEETATVVTGTNCTDNQPTGTAEVTFTDPPLADIQVNFRDGGSGETALSGDEISCTGLTATSTTPPTGWDDSKTFEDLAIDPSPRTITCTIEIDP